MSRLVLIIVLLCFGCQTGRIPCPKFKTKSGHHKRYRNYSSALTAKAEDKDEITKASRTQELKFVRNVSVEDWDCPQPGSKKYLPKTVRDNIRRNTKKVNEDLRRAAADTTAID
jgi:hypothetical protein